MRDIGRRLSACERQGSTTETASSAARRATLRANRATDGFASNPSVERDSVADVRDYAVVAGATGALGAAIVRRLSARGLDVIAIARNADELARLVDSDRVIPLRGDLADDALTGELAALVDRPVRIVVQAAGLPASGDIDTITGAEIAAGFDTKIGGLLRLIRAVAAHLGDGSRIVTLGGHYGYEPSPAAPLAGMVNAALNNLVRSLADRWGAAGVTVHVVAPGPVESPRMSAIATRIAERRDDGTTADQVLDDYRRGSPLGRLTTIDEVAWAVDLLVEPEAAALHGSTLSLDVGRRRGAG